MEKLWNFTDNSGSFFSAGADKVRSLYFPLGNESIMSCVTADLHGDIKSGQDSFLLAPVSRVDLSDLRSSRNFWIRFDAHKIWSATGVSKDSKRIKEDKFSLRAGLLWQEIERRNKEMGLGVRVLSFVPVTGEPVEIMQVEITNVSRKTVSFIPTAAIPVYGRGAGNIRDHRHVTSLLHRVTLHKFGVVCRPTLAFDETGHRRNKNNYFVLGWGDKFSPPQRIYSSRDVFCGDSGDLEEPEAVFGKAPEGEDYIQGKEVMGGLGFARVSLRPGQSRVYTVLMGITDDRKAIPGIIAKFNRAEKISLALEKNKRFWSGLSRGIDFSTRDEGFDNWTRWVNIQPTLRNIFGCSFLPDFDYGKGGRGWRDLWQDCLGLILSDPARVRALLVNNFGGVKIDGSNATIIGKSAGEFIADRDNISRVWMDHGVWPLLTLDLYIHETGDTGVLFEQASYFYNREIRRTAAIDREWTPSFGNKLKTSSGKVYKGSVLEHVLLQNLVQFFNVGSHNHVRLEGADWNDGLDMAKENGESVAFSAMYAQNLNTLSGLLLKMPGGKIEVAEEIGILLSGADYASVSSKRRVLERYFSKACTGVSGRKIRLDPGKLAADLEGKSRWIKRHIASAEWLKEGFFNGYYDNRRMRLEGRKGGIMQMTLTGQVFAIMAGIAGPSQVRAILNNVNRYLLDKRGGGVRLNTDFRKEQPDLGRAFSFSYGDKENGAVFSHMAVMFSYALYKQGYVRQAWETLDALYRMSCDSARSRIYPCLPEYFDLSGRGMYSYLTGSASWFILTLLTQAFGVRGQDGDLIIEPKLSPEHFRRGGRAGVERMFAGRRIRVNFIKRGKLEYGKYGICGARLNGRPLPVEKRPYLVFTRELLLSLPEDRLNCIDIYLA
jgi:cellobiose phosphorylase